MLVFSIISLVLSVIFTAFFAVGFFTMSYDREVPDEEPNGCWLMLVYVVCGIVWLVTSLMLTLIYCGVLVV